MPKFHYTAKRGPRDMVEGVMEAENRNGVLAQLTQLGYVPVRISETETAPQAPLAPAPRAVSVRRVPSAHLAVLTRQFASLVRSYVPIMRTLSILEEQTRHASLRRVIHDVAEAVRQGQTLSSAMAQFPKVFPPLYVNLIRSGEASGTLDAVLDRLAVQSEQDEAMRSKLRMAFIYPAFVGLVGCATVVFLMTFVMPRLSKLLLGLGERLPLPTRMLLAASDWMSGWEFWVVASAGVAVVALGWRIAGEQGRTLLDRLILKAPLLGRLVLQAEMARFARSFGLQISHGLPILQAADVATQVVTHRILRSELARLPEGLRQGETLSNGLRGLSIGSPFLVNTVAVGEESGKVGEALLEVAAYYERDTERLLQTMATLLEPMLILSVGLVVGFIVMAVLLPIFEMGTGNL